MTTNFEWRAAPSPTCPTCGHSDAPEVLFIGKSAMGWVFSLRVYDQQDHPGAPQSLDDWRERFARPGSSIWDEYGEQLTPEAMIAWILERGREDYSWTPADDAAASRNSAQRGPRGLWRSAPSCFRAPDHKVEPAPDGGTYELVWYEFS